MHRGWRARAGAAVTRGPCSPSDMHLVAIHHLTSHLIQLTSLPSQELAAPIFLCLLTIPSLEAAPQFRGLLRSFFNFNGFPVLDPNEAEQNKKFPTIFSNGLNEVSQATQSVRFQSGRVPTTTRARPTVTTTRIKITKIVTSRGRRKVSIIILIRFTVN